MLCCKYKWYNGLVIGALFLAGRRDFVFLLQPMAKLFFVQRDSPMKTILNRLHLLPSCAVLCILFLYSCGVGNEIHVEKTNAEDVVDLRQNLVFSMNKPLVPDSLLNIWDTTSYVTFTPPIKGKYKWTAANELVFSPSVSLQPSTKYTAVLTQAVVLHTKEKYSVSPEVLSFHTPYQALESVGVYWSKSKESGAIGVTATLQFTYGVNAAEVGRLLHLEADGKPVQCSVQSASVGNQVSVFISGLQPREHDDIPLHVVIDKGLTLPGSDWVSQEPMEQNVSIPAPNAFAVTGVTTSYDSERNIVYVYTTQSIDDHQDMRSLVHVQPATPFDIELLDNGMALRGDFVAGTAYEISIDRTLRGIFGEELPDKFSQFVEFGEREPSLSFSTTKAMYLSTKGSKAIGLSISSIPRVKVTVAKIYENNILAYLSNGESYDYYYDELSEADYWVQGFGRWENFGDVVYEKEYDTKHLPSANGIHHLSLDLPDNSSYKGIYVVKVISTDRQWLQDSRLVSVSDIGLITKETQDEVLVFANSIKDVTPLSGVDVKLISHNNQQVLSATTDRDGVARFEKAQASLPEFRLAMITARSGNDFNAMVLQGTKVETSRYDVGGARENATGLQAFIYGERNMYRPGETIHLNTVVRNEQWQPVPKVPIKIKLLLPNGKVYKAVKATPNEQGASESVFPLPSSAITGTYIAEVYSANDVLMNSYPISVEEFMPDRIRVTLNVDKQAMSNRDSVHVRAYAVNLFGPPAAGRNYEMQFLLRRREFQPKGYGKYTFSVHTKNDVSLDDIVHQGKTDDEGIAVQTFGIPAGLDDIGLLAGRVYATVFDETGRPVNRLEQVDVYTQNVFFGIKRFDEYNATRKPVSAQLVALDKGGVPIAAKAHVQVIRFNWQNVIERSPNGSFRYVSQKKEQVVSERIVSVSGTATSFSYIPTVSGEYELRVLKPGGENYVSHRFYAYGWGDTQASSFEVNTEGQVEIEFDKPKYNVGEVANILFKTPFAGRLLVTVERNKVYEHFVVETDKKSASVSLSIKEEYLPNVYVSATLIKPLDDNTLPLTVAHGIAPLHIEDAATRLPVSIRVPSNSRSKTKQTVVVQTGGGQDVDVTIAVVDEGILQLKDFQTPSPHAFFFRKRALQVQSYNIYPYLFPELVKKKSSTGGDGFDLQKRINPLSNRRVQLVSFWSGILTTNSKGEASITVDIPQFSGDLRVMAVAYKGRTFGSADAHIKVADPVVVSTALPRFISPGDTVFMPVTLTNTTEKKGEVTAEVKATGGIRVVGEVKRSATVQAGREEQVQFALVAPHAIGTADVEVIVRGLNGTYSDKTSLTIRPTTSLLKTTGMGEVKSGATTTVSLRHSFTPESAEGRLVVSRTPLARFTTDLRYLLEYPHGCVEQTVSGAFPQLYVPELATALRDRPIHASIPQDNIQGAVRRLASMQLYNGALSYWPGGITESWWGTVYAAHFLVEAQRAGYDIQQQQLDRMLGYLIKKVRARSYETYRYYDGTNRFVTTQIPAKDLFYSLYVLALAGKHDIATMNYYKARLDSMALDSRYLLAGSYLLAGDRRSYTSILPKAFSGERSERSMGGSFYSYVRDEAIALNAMLEGDPDNPQIIGMIKHLSEQLNTQKWLSTQERAFALLALGKSVRRAGAGSATATVRAGGKTLGQMDNGNLVLTNFPLGEQINIEAKGGPVYYFWEVEGINASGDYKQEDNFLRVRKEFLSRSGKPLSGSTFKQNDLVVVRVSVVSNRGEEVENVVITDMLPAGFEIENPRIGAVPELAWIKDSATPDHFDIRDDRIHYFTTVKKKEQHYYYLVRAVSRGVFRMGPVSAEAMYNGEYHSAHGAGTVRVE